MSDVREGSRVALCRCGASRNKPFCHNSHQLVVLPSVSLRSIDSIERTTAHREGARWTRRRTPDGNQ
ncbi:MAG: CDGSH iron-sulfur domain-containing protein [Actinomycetota bacterium]